MGLRAPQHTLSCPLDCRGPHYSTHRPCSFQGSSELSVACISNIDPFFPPPPWLPLSSSRQLWFLLRLPWGPLLGCCVAGLEGKVDLILQLPWLDVGLLVGRQAWQVVSLLPRQSPGSGCRPAADGSLSKTAPFVLDSQTLPLVIFTEPWKEP